MPILYKEVDQIDKLENIANKIKSSMFPLGCNIEIVICNNDYIKQVNKETLQHDYSTDIITFYYDEINPENDAELLISIEQVAQNAESYNVSLDHELKRVIIHGCLHLKGYDDKTKVEKSMMRAEEDKYLNKLFHVEQN